MFLEDIVLSSTEVGSALGVPLSILAVSARASTGPFIVIYVLKVEFQATLPRAHSSIRTPTMLPPLACQTFQLPTPINIRHLLFFLSGYTHSIVQFLTAGFTEGFPLHYEGPHFSFQASNLKSALQNPAAVTAKLSKELEAQRIAGPFYSLPFPMFQISPLGLVRKKTEGEFRLIHHLSFPNGFSLNDGIPLDYTSVSDATVAAAIRVMKSVGQGCFLAKTDIKNVFQIIPIRPQDYSL